MHHGEEGRQRSGTVIGRPPTTITQQLHTLFALMAQRSSLAAEGAAQPLEFNRSDGLAVVGNNGRTEVRVYHQNTNLGPYTDNFIDRGRSIFDAALIILDQPKGRLSPELMVLWDYFSKQIKDTCHIDPIQMSHALRDPKYVDNYFWPIYNRALYYLTQLCRELSLLIKSEFETKLEIEMKVELDKTASNAHSDIRKKYEKMKEELTVKYASKILRNVETELIKSSGRANLVHVIDLDIANTQLISCLSTATPVTTPSNITSAGNRNLVWQDICLKKGDKVIPVESAIRLGAISSFGETDTIKRKVLNAENANELLKVAAVGKITEEGLNLDNYTSENPLELKIFSTTLLSPYHEYISKFLSEVIPDELQMLQEHHEALMLYHNRKFPLEITLNNGQKRTIYVKPNIMHFNVPANIEIELQHKFISDDQDNINAEGGVKYLREAAAYLNKDWLNPSQFSDNRFDHLRKDIQIIKSDLKEALAAIEQNKEFQNSIKKLNDNVAIYQKDLANENEAALKCLAILKNDPKELTAASNYERHQQNIKNKNDQLYRSYNEIYTVYKNIIKQNTAIFDTYYDNISKFLSKNKDFLSRPENFALKQQLLVGLAYLNSQKMMFEEDPNVNYKFKENCKLFSN